ncbi:alpha-amylase family glycosyl hydrolase [Succinatimonas hippei]|uniref:alpha-amylase family glycosyl hydrolase n=1 Tax=Succinatimonas hippei TaxID=626938 RepID=UPI0023F94FFC|nr:alpha-amylase family glycosyl hydrolase [Succinatimonas hippei]
MRQNTSSPRSNLPFQCFHTCTAPGTNHKTVVLYVRGANPRRLSCKLVSFPQHEPKRVEMLYIGSKSGIHRFTAKLTVDEGDNFQWYCFKISLLNSSSQTTDVVWYSSLGMSRECPLIHHCFAFELNASHPSWVKDLVLYEIFPDRFACSKDYFTIDADHYAADTPIHANVFEYKNLDEVHCGGDLDGTADMLPYLKDMGISGICLSPIFKAPSPKKLDTEDYDVIDPHFGGNGALKRLRQKTSDLDMRLILSATLNHTGDNHPWFDRMERTGKGALHHKDSPYRDYYSFLPNDQAVYFNDNPNCPKLNYASRAIRHMMYKGANSVVKKWISGAYDADGLIIAHASQIGDNGTSRNNLKRLAQICKEARSVHPDCLMIGDYRSDARYVLNTDQNLDGAINYTGFISPIRAFFGGMNLTGDPIPYTGEDFRRTCENYSVGVAQEIKLCLINQLDNSTMPRFFEILGGEKSLYLSALAVLFTWRGIPCVYQGDELGDILDQYEIGPSSPLPYIAMRDHKITPYSKIVSTAVKELSDIRRSNPALTLGSLVFITSGGAYFGYIRLYNDRFSIVLVNASRQAMKIEQGSILFPLLAAMYLPDDNTADSDNNADSGESLLIPLSGRNIRRTDHGEGLEALYDLLSKEKLSVSCFGLTKSSEEFSENFIKELVAGKTITMPARTTVIINNEKKD